MPGARLGKGAPDAKCSCAAQSLSRDAAAILPEGPERIRGTSVLGKAWTNSQKDGAAPRRAVFRRCGRFYTPSPQTWNYHERKKQGAVSRAIVPVPMC
jgi:hypothetical protein